MGASKVRYGIIGYGAFAERAIAPAFELARNAELVAIQKRSIAVARAKADERHIPLAFSDPRELVAHPEVDAVFIASANSQHQPETVLAAEAGKHVLVEKPMAINSSECKRMIDACASAGVKLMVAHKVRFSPLVRRMRDLVAQGAIGEIRAARADFVFSGALSSRTWMTDRTTAGGGPVFDIGVHCLDTLRFVLDDEVVSVSAELAPRPTATSTEHSAQIALTFSAGTIGSIFCSFMAPMRRSFIRIMGSTGILSAEDFTTDSRSLTLIHRMGKEGVIVREQQEKFEVPNLLSAEIAHFSECIRKGLPNISSGESGLRNQIVLDAVMECTGQTVGW